MIENKNIKINKKIINFKILFIIVLIVALLEGFYIYRLSDQVNNIILPSYYFGDLNEKGSDGLVTAKGSFISTIDFAYPVQTSYIECWKEFNYCWISDASLSKDNFLSMGMNLKEIQYWTDDFIETKPDSLLGNCVEESYRLDRRSKIVTYTSKTLNNTTEFSKGIQDEPITATLGDGFKRLEIYNKMHNK